MFRRDSLIRCSQCKKVWTINTCGRCTRCIDALPPKPKSILRQKSFPIRPRKKPIPKETVNEVMDLRVLEELREQKEKQRVARLQGSWRAPTVRITKSKEN